MSPYRPLPMEDREQGLWILLDDALERWSSDPDAAAEIARWIWKDARAMGCCDVELAADAFLVSLAAGTWF